MMKFVDLAAQQKNIRTEIETKIQTVLDHGQYIMGPEVGELENRLAEYCGVKYAIGCASGTDALLLALLALDIKPGDAVLTTPFTFIATAEVIQLIGAIPVFVDIDPRTFNMDPSLLEKTLLAMKNNDPSEIPLPRLERKNGALRPKAVIAVDLFGLPADYGRINTICKEHGLVVVEDAAQSFGARLNEMPAGSLSDFACTSFFPAKPLGCYGDGGMCFTDNDGLAQKVKSLRIHGKGSNKYDNVRIGINGRLDTLQAAILLVKMDIFDTEITRRSEIATNYSKLLFNSELSRPLEPKGYRSAWAQYSLLAKDGESR